MRRRGQTRNGAARNLTFGVRARCSYRTCKEIRLTASLPVLRGTLDLLVLRALLAQPMHGYEITSWLDRQTAGNLAVLDSALYQALYRLEKARLIGAEWGLSENNRRARYYHVTARGRAHLRAETTSWIRYAELVTSVLTAPVAAG